MRWCALAAMALAACRSSAVFPCSSDGECDAGVCTSEGWCAFPDTDCASGLRFGEFAAPELAGECVDAETIGTDASTSSTSASTTSATSPTSPETSDASTTTMAVDDESSATDTTPCPPDWWDCEWSHRRRIDVGAKSPELVEQFPAQVLLTPDRIDFEVAAPGGADIRFVQDGEVLAHELVGWGPRNAELWVRVPRLPSRAPIHLYYGNSNAADIARPLDVWSNDYRAVLHFRDETDSCGLLALESTAVEPDLGLLGSALRFDGASSYLRDRGPPIDVFANGGTLSVVFNATGWGESSFGRLVDASDINTTATGWSLAITAAGDGGLEAVRFGRGHATNRGTWYTPDNSMALDTWIVASASYDDNELTAPQLWLFGQAVPPVIAEAPAGAPVSAPLPITIGALATTDLRFFDGIIDEIHIAGLRSDAWIAAEHLSFTDQMLIFGTAESH